jgi:multiple sugar transport system ATP-binding protein
MAELVLDGIGKTFGGIGVLQDINLSVANGEFVVLVGPSGCGKSTLLRIIAGLETASRGTLLIGGRPANDVPPQKRNLAMVFQSYALFPHMTAKDNIAYGPRLRGEDKGVIESKVERAAEMLNLGGYLARLPRQLSGGQRQRVAMGRAVVREPHAFLFDEPLSNLDAKLRVQMRAEIKALHKRLGVTVVYVTHDQIEAMTMADRIVVMNKGKVEQIGTPIELYDRPQNLFVAGFLGTPAINLLEGVLKIDNKGAVLELDNGMPVRLPKTQDLGEGRRIAVGIRPEDLSLAEHGLTLAIDLVELTGAETHLVGHVGQTPVIASVRRRVPAETASVQISFAPEKLHFFDAASGERIN